MYLLFDIGGTQLRLAISKTGRQLDSYATVPTPRNFTDGIKVIYKLGRQIAKNAPIQTMAGGIHGSLNAKKTAIISCPHLPGWINKPLVASLSQIFKCRVFLENDANVAGLGEAVYGAGRRYQIVAFLTISTGVGGTRICHKRFDVNATGFEPGQQIINADRPAFLPNRSGRLEGYISGTALASKYGKNAKNLDNLMVWREFERYLGYGLVNIVRLWSPHVIVLGGGVMANSHISIRKVNRELRRALKKLPVLPPVVRGMLGQKAGLYGALSFLKQQK